MSVTCICKICGTSFSMRQSYFDAGRRCCSRKCADVWHSKVMIKKNAVLHPKIIKNCLICNKEFRIKPSRDKKGFGKFCSQRCRGIWSSEHIHGETSYSWKWGLITQICEICGKEFLAKPSHVKNGHNKFCSRKCMGIHRSKNYNGENHPNWKGGASFAPYPVEWKKELKEKIRIRDNNKCFLCKKSDTDKRLSIHHIDYDKNNLDPKNLISLCNRCHTKTNHNREYWMNIFHTMFNDLGVHLEIQ